MAPHIVAGPGVGLSDSSRLPFARNWGEGVSASSDGQFFRTGRIRSGAAEINAKYDHKPGIKIYSHLSDHFASFSSRIMSATASEAPYVLDGLMLGARDLPLQALHPDTGGPPDPPGRPSRPVFPCQPGSNR